MDLQSAVGLGYSLAATLRLSRITKAAHKMELMSQQVEQVLEHQQVSTRGCVLRVGCMD